MMEHRCRCQECNAPIEPELRPLNRLEEIIPGVVVGWLGSCLVEYDSDTAICIRHRSEERREEEEIWLTVAEAERLANWLNDAAEEVGEYLHFRTKVVDDRGNEE